MRRSYKILITVLIMTLLDQIIKLIIHFNFMDKNFDILFHFIGFEPYLNVKYSWINTLGDFGISRLSHILIVVFILIIAIIAYDMFAFYKIRDTITYIFFCFLFAGALCSLIDKLFWGGSLDYIRLDGLFIFDLKDVYATVCEIIIVIMLIINYRGIRTRKLKELLMDIKTYFKQRYRKPSL